jgi:4-amino-4-deoxy-L-arabinose transferase-like glycosyltransferase
MTYDKKQSQSSGEIMPVARELSLPVTPIPSIPNTPIPAVSEQFVSSPSTFDISTVITSSLRAVVPSGVLHSLYPLADETTIKISTPERRRALPRWEVLLVVALLLIAALAHGLNMFNFPYYEDDEGTYMSQAWAVVNEGQLAPYTYWYDHAPAGWIQISAWTIVSGGFHMFGTAIESGRVFMLLMQLCSTFMLYCIARRISRSVPIAVMVSLLFALSPYGIYFHRRVLLDNITTFWMLLSILLLVLERLSLKRVWLSALALGISILSKEVTVFLVPAMAYLVFFRTDRSHRLLATVGWIVLVSSVISLYLLMATVKGELFPTGTLLGGTAPHVSFLGTLQFQTSRGKDGGFFDFHSGFWHLAQVWAKDDPVLVVGGSLCALLSLLAIKKQRLISIMGLLTLSLCYFLGRGGEVIGFYLVPLLPLLALNIGLLLGLLIEQLKSLLKSLTSIRVARIMELVAVGLCVASIWLGYTSPDLGFDKNPFLLWNGSQAVAQRQAISWVLVHIPPKSTIVIDQYMWTDLHDQYQNNDVFAHYYWKVEQDPAIRDKVFHNDWHNIDYVVTTIQMLTDVQESHMTLVGAAIDHSTIIAHFESGGWPIEVRKVNKGCSTQFVTATHGDCALQQRHASQQQTTNSHVAPMVSFYAKSAFTAPIE